jgi:hypothetical protein
MKRTNFWRGIAGAGVSFLLTVSMAVTGSTGASAALPIPDPGTPVGRTPGTVVQGPWVQQPTKTPTIPKGVAVGAVASFIPMIMGSGWSWLIDSSAQQAASNPGKCYQNQGIGGTPLQLPFLLQDCDAEHQAAWDASGSSRPSVPTETLPDGFWEALSLQGGAGLELLLGDAGANWSPSKVMDGWIEVTPTDFEPTSKLSYGGQGHPGTECDKAFQTSCTAAISNAQATETSAGICRRADGSFTGVGNAAPGQQTEYLAVASGTAVNLRDFCTAQSGGQISELVWIKWGTNTSGPVWNATKPGGWINPNPNLASYATRILRNEIVCRLAGGGGNTVTVSNETVGTGTVALASCPAGYVPESGKTTVDGIPGQDAKEISNWGIPDTARQQYPECIGLQAVGCAIAIEVDGQPCAIGNADCADWMGVQSTNPGRVKCFWGPYEMSPTQCSGLTNAYQEGAENGLRRFPEQEVGAEPLPLFNPEYNPNPNPSPSPSPSPSVNPSTNPSPNPSTVPTVPATNPGTPPTTGENPANADFASCLGKMWTWNPVDWVAVPVGCALAWAFVPNAQAAQAKGQQIKDKLDELGIAGPIVAVQETMASLPAGGGCAGPTIVFSIRTVHQTFQPLNACSEPMSTVASLANAAGSLYLVLFGSIGFVRALSSAFGYHFYFGGGGKADE